MLRDERGWCTAKLNNHLKNTRYKWGYCVLPDDPAVEGGAVKHQANLEPGQQWGVLKGVNTELDLSKVEIFTI